MKSLAMRGVQNGSQEWEMSLNSALIGLWKAAKAFDPALKTNFKSFATPRVRGEIVDQLRTEDIVSRRDRLEGNAPAIASLDEPTKHDGDADFKSLISDKTKPPDVELAELEATAKEIREVLSSVHGNERTVLELYYLQDMTLKEVGVRLGLSESRINQIHNSAVETARRAIRLKAHLAAEDKVEAENGGRKLVKRQVLPHDSAAVIGKALCSMCKDRPANGIGFMCNICLATL